MGEKDGKIKWYPTGVSLRPWNQDSPAWMSLFWTCFHEVFKGCGISALDKIRFELKWKIWMSWLFC